MDSKTKGDSEHTALGRGGEGGRGRAGRRMLSHKGCLSAGQPASFLSWTREKQRRLPAGYIEGGGYCLLYVWDSSHRTTSKAWQEESSTSFLTTLHLWKTTLFKATKALCNALLLKFTGMGFMNGKAPTRVLENTNVQPRLLLLFKLWPILPT